MNYALQKMSRDEFVHMLTAELPERPSYFSRDAEINRTGAAALEDLPPLTPLSPAEVAQRQGEGAVVVDTRTGGEYGAGHVPGSVNVALSGQFASWAGTLLGLDQSIVLVAEEPERIAEARMRLARVGIEKVVGYLDGGILAWQKAGRALAEVPQISVNDLAQQLAEAPGEIQVVDVRRPQEWEVGHIAGASLRPLNTLASKLDGLDRARPVAVHCKSGYRSSIGTSILERAGFTAVMNVIGGFDAWQAQKLPVVVSTATSVGSATSASTTSGASTDATQPAGAKAR